MCRVLFGAFVALLALNGAAAAQTTADQTAPARANCALPKVANSVALNPVPGSDLMTVPVSVNGTPKQFLLAVGTGPTEVSQATVSQLSLPHSTTASERITFTPAMGGYTNAAPGSLQQMSASVYDVEGSQSRADTRRRVRIESFTIGDATAHDMLFVVGNDRELGNSKPYDGLLTGDFFKQYDVELDFAGKRITYLTPTKCSDPNQVVYWPHSAVAVIPMTISGGKIQVAVTIEGHPIDAIIDTSSAQTVMRRDIAELTFGLKTGTPEVKPDGDLEDGWGEQVYIHTFPQIAFEGVVANNVPVLIQTNGMVRDLDRQPILGSRAQFASAPRIPDLTLGMDVLRQLHLYVVFGQETLYITAAK